MRIFSALLAALVFSCPTAPPLFADMFRWVDEKGVVHFTDNLHNIPQQHRDSSVKIKTTDSPRGPEPASSVSPDKASVPLQRKGEVMIVQATVNEKAAAKFVVDTGASYTMISVATAKELELDLDKRSDTVPFQTANGIIHAPLVTLDSIEVGGIKVKGLIAAVYDVFPDASISGLLGLNFLTNFRLDIDTKNGVLHLEKK